VQGQDEVVLGLWAVVMELQEQLQLLACRL
jgi:hypothetical protein